MTIKTNDCAGCADCINCGRKQEYTYHVCDQCEDCTTLYQYGDKELCAYCLIDCMLKDGAIREVGEGEE